MLIKKIILSEPIVLKISGIEVFGKDANKLDIDNIMVSTQTETTILGNNTKEISWNFVLDTPQDISKITFLQTNGHDVKCYDDSNSLVYSRISLGEQSIDNLTSFSAIIQPFNATGNFESTACMGDTQYNFIPCYDTTVEKCPDIYSEVPKEIFPYLNVSTTNLKWSVLNQNKCSVSSAGWSECINGIRKRTCDSSKEKCSTVEEPCFPGISDWGDWSECKNGTSTRIRICDVNKHVDKCTNIILSENRNCADFILGDFGDFGPCVNGVSTKTRNCTPGYNSTNINCPPIEQLTETKNCNGDNIESPISPEWLPIIIPLIVVAFLTIIFLVVFLRKR